MKYFISDCTLYVPSKSTLLTAFFRPTNRDFTCRVQYLTTEGWHPLPLPFLIPVMLGFSVLLTGHCSSHFVILWCFFHLRLCFRCMYLVMAQGSSQGLPQSPGPCQQLFIFPPHYVGLGAMSIPAPPEPCTKPDPQRAPSMMFLFFPN